MTCDKLTILFWQNDNHSKWHKYTDKLTKWQKHFNKNTCEKWQIDNDVGLQIDIGFITNWHTLLTNKQKYTDKLTKWQKINDELTKINDS